MGGHVARIGETKLVGKHERKILLRSARIREDNIKMGLREMGCEDMGCIHLGFEVLTTASMKMAVF
jgi:hypothetical protein